MSDRDPRSQMPRAAPRRQRLTRAQRVTSRADFVRVQDGGLRVSTPHLLLLVAAQPPAPSSAAPGVVAGAAAERDEPPASLARLGIVASRKIGGAVVRNRAKRLLREAFRRHPELLPPRVDLVAIVRSGLADLSYAEVEAELLAAAAPLARRAADALAGKARKRGSP